MKFKNGLTLTGSLVLACLLVGVGSEASTSTVDRVFGRSTDSWPIFARAGVTTRVVVDGAGATDLDVYVYDEYGHLIDSDTDYTDYCVVSWTPLWSGYFTVKVVNRGNLSNVYRLTID